MRREALLAAGVLLLGVTSLVAGEEAEEPFDGLGISSEADVSGDQIEAIVRSLAEEPRWLVRIDATFLRIEAAQAEAILGEHRPAKMGSAVFVPAKLGRLLIERARGRGPIRPEPLPPLVLGHGHAGRLSATGRHTYLQDYEEERGGPADHPGRPLAGRLEDGTRLDVKPRRTEDGMRLGLAAGWAEVVRPIPVFESSHPPVTIELPEMRYVDHKSEVELPKEGGFVLAGRGFAWDQKTLRLVVLEVRPAGR